MPTPVAQSWPRLSADLRTLSHPAHCARCGVGRDLLGETTEPLVVWREHDQDDKPEPIFVVLCEPCSARIIEPHPRLYARLVPHHPAPGAMPICTPCRHREGTACLHPAGLLRGGPGVGGPGSANLLTYPEPTRIHLLCRGANRRQSGWHWLFHGPVTACAGREQS